MKGYEMNTNHLRADQLRKGMFLEVGQPLTPSGLSFTPDMTNKDNMKHIFDVEIIGVGEYREQVTIIGIDGNGVEWSWLLPKETAVIRKEFPQLS